MREFQPYFLGGGLGKDEYTSPMNCSKLLCHSKGLELFRRVRAIPRNLFLWNQLGEFQPKETEIPFHWVRARQSHVIQGNMGHLQRMTESLCKGPGGFCRGKCQCKSSMVMGAPPSPPQQVCLVVCPRDAKGQL